MEELVDLAEEFSALALCRACDNDERFRYG
jgi:hypothetical protein